MLLPQNNSQLLPQLARMVSYGKSYELFWGTSIFHRHKISPLSHTITLSPTQCKHMHSVKRKIVVLLKNVEKKICPAKLFQRKNL